MNIVKYKGWENNIHLTNGIVELVITLDIGPRIIRYGFVNEVNLFGELSDQLGKSKEDEWMLRGGHRLWIAPESKGVSYEHDNHPISFKKIESGVCIFQNPGEESGIQKIMGIKLLPDNGVAIRHILKNTTDEIQRYSVWPITVMHKGGSVIIPLPKKDPFGQHSDIPNQIWSIWSFTDIRDSRFNIEERKIRIVNDDECRPFKMGFTNMQGWVAYHIDNYLFMKHFLYKSDKTYPDGNVNFEIYMDNEIVELETLGPLVKVQPGKSIIHDEKWNIYKENNIPDNIINNYL